MNVIEKEGAALNLPNALSLLRLFAIPVVVVCLLFPGRSGSFLAALFFSIAFVTDFLDGYLARKYGTVTALGKFLDPLADKILVCVTLIMLIPLDRAPAWIVGIIVAREIAVTGLRGAAVTEGIVIQASKLGKYKTFFQAMATIALCLHYQYVGVDLHTVGKVLLWVALVFTLLSGWAYFQAFYGVFFPRKGS
ncbi:MAG: CDP-diacylglycerol--glycerol-3-phosphate 3-phosphatidyltransferase [Deltaproteobacteria bacterium]|nr:CDP-diacylglycerol--glycerol-3-phosphate 3-phosphatidyltransferase [Deltaproteobacteria bacterium]